MALQLLFFFGDSKQTHDCYHLDVQRCLTNAFQEMQAETKRATGLTGAVSTSTGNSFAMLGLVDTTKHNQTSFSSELLDKSLIETNNPSDKRSRRRKTAALSAKNRHLCSANRPYLACFQLPGCSDETTARVASGVFYGIHGRVFPVQVFLSHRGYALQLCSHSCSRESRAFCQRQMSQQEQNEEHGFYLELVGLSRQIQIALDRRGAWEVCTRFKDALQMVVRYRARFCGEAAKCACADSRIQGAVTFCRGGCEAILEQISTASFSSMDGSYNAFLENRSTPSIRFLSPLSGNFFVISCLLFHLLLQRIVSDL